MIKDNLPTKLRSLRIAIAHDWLNQFGGGEQVLLDIAELFPDAPIYTLVYDEQATYGLFKNKKIHTSWLQKFPHHFRVRGRKLLLPFCARATESLDLNGYDLVISTSNPWVKGVILPQDTIHISYLHAATRFLWDWREEYLREQNLNWLTDKIAQFFLFRTRQWDRLAADRPDYLLCNSETTRKRIWKYYRRDAHVIYPGIRALDKFTPQTKNRGYFLILSRLSPYKKIDIAVRVFNHLGLPLRIAGTGSAKNELQQLANSNVQILGRVSDHKKRELFENCRGFIVLADDDFGITTVEALAAGKPVLALRAGGAIEIIQENENGIFFDELSELTLASAIEKFNQISWSAKTIRQSAEKYSKQNFQKQLLDFIDSIL